MKVAINNKKSNDGLANIRRLLNLPAKKSKEGKAHKPATAATSATTTAADRLDESELKVKKPTKTYAPKKKKVEIATEPCEELYCQVVIQSKGFGEKQATMGRKSQHEFKLPMPTKDFLEQRKKKGNAEIVYP